MSGQGKGDKWRKWFNYKKYWTNFEELTGNDKDFYSQVEKVVKKRGAKTTYVYKR